MQKDRKILPKGSIPLIAIENIEAGRPIIKWKHKSKHMAFSSKEQLDIDPDQVIIRSDGIAYDPNTGTFYQTPKFNT